jgi:hypothetical protein
MRLTGYLQLLGKSRSDFLKLPKDQQLIVVKGIMQSNIAPNVAHLKLDIPENWYNMFIESRVKDQLTKDGRLYNQLGSIFKVDHNPPGNFRDPEVLNNTLNEWMIDLYDGPEFHNAANIINQRSLEHIYRPGGNLMKEAEINFYNRKSSFGKKPYSKAKTKSYALLLRDIIFLKKK